MFGGNGGSIKSQALPVIKKEDPAAQEAAADALRRKQAGKGYRSTVISSWMNEGKGSTFGS